MTVTIGKPTNSAGKVKVQLHIPADLHERMRREKLLNGRQPGFIVEQALRAYLGMPATETIDNA